MAESKFIPARLGFGGSILNYLSHAVFANAEGNQPSFIAEHGLEGSVNRLVVAPVICGVYFLVLDGTVVYVGQSVDMHARVRGHVPNKEFDSIFYIEVEESKLSEVELHWIQKLRPRLNGQCKDKVRIAERVAQTMRRIGVSSIKLTSQNALLAIAKDLGIQNDPNHAQRIINALSRYSGPLVKYKTQDNARSSKHSVLAFKLPEYEHDATRANQVR